MVFVIWSRSCSNQFKRGMEFPQGIWNLGKKDFRYSWPLEKVRFLNKNLRLFRISNLKKGLFHLVKELFKSIQTRHGVSSGYIKTRKKEFPV